MPSLYSRNGEAYIVGKAGSESIIKYSQLCNLEEAPTNKYGLTSTTSMRWMVLQGSSRYRKNYKRQRGIFLTGSQDNNASRSVYKG